MRLTAEEAKRLGLIDERAAKQMRGASRRGAPVVSDAVAALNADRLADLKAMAEHVAGPAPAQGARPKAVRGVAAGGKLAPGSKGYTEQETSPQRILFEALVKRFPDREVVWEATGLIPGRKFSADIMIPPRVVIEMDGFSFHRSKDAYQADRDRQNLFVTHGFLPIRAYAKQIFDSERREQLLELIARTLELADD